MESLVNGQERRFAAVNIANALRRTSQRLKLPCTYDVLLVDSRHGLSLTAIAEGFRTFVVDPTRFPIIVSPRYLLELIRFRRGVSRVSRHLLAIASASKAKIILATDAVKDLTEVASLRPEVTTMAVMHGFYIDQQGKNVREAWAELKPSSTLLYAMGRYDLDHYRRWGNVHTRIDPVGSANNCLYVTSNQLPTNRVFDICIVQGAINPIAEDEFARTRLSNWEKITEYIQQLSERTPLKIVIAIGLSSKQVLIEEWFTTRFPTATFVRTSDDPFSTYKAIDSAWISIGEASTSLVEGLARKNRCLAINFSNLGLLSLPAPDLVALKNPSYQAFEERYWQLRKMDDQDFWEEVKGEVGYLINTDEQHLTITKIRDQVARECGLSLN